MFNSPTFFAVVEGWHKLGEVIAVVVDDFGGKTCAIPAADGMPIFCGCGCLEVTWIGFLDLVLCEDLHYIFSTKINSNQRQYPGFKRDDPICETSFLARVECGSRGSGTIWGPLLQRTGCWMGLGFGHSAVPLASTLFINNLWRTRKSKTWAVGTFPFTVRSHVQYLTFPNL